MGKLAQRARMTGPRLLPFRNLKGPLLGEAESQGPRGPTAAGAAWLPPPRLTLAQTGDQGCGSWEMPGPTLLTLRPLSSEPELPTSCPGDVSSGQREGSWGWGRAFQKPPGLGRRKACLFVQNQGVFTGLSQPPARLLPHFLDCCFA